MRVILVYGGAAAELYFLKSPILPVTHSIRLSFSAIVMTFVIFKVPLGSLQGGGLCHRPPAALVRRWSNALFASEIPYFLPPWSNWWFPCSRPASGYPLCGSDIAPFLTSPNHVFSLTLFRILYLKYGNIYSSLFSETRRFLFLNVTPTIIHSLADINLLSGGV